MVQAGWAAGSLAGAVGAAAAVLNRGEDGEKPEKILSSCQCFDFGGIVLFFWFRSEN